MPDAKPEFIPTRRSLLTRLKNWDDQEGWRVFFDTYWRLLYGAAVKSGLTDAEAQEAVQETVLAVAKKMPAFKYDPALGSFKGWLLTLTRWRIAAQFRKRARDAVMFEPSPDDPAALAQFADPQAQAGFDDLWEEEWESNLLEVALERVKERVTPRQFQIFQLYALQQWPVKKVASALGVSSAQVYVAKHRVAAVLKKEMTRISRKGF